MSSLIVDHSFVMDSRFRLCQTRVRVCKTVLSLFTHYSTKALVNGLQGEANAELNIGPSLVVLISLTFHRLSAYQLTLRSDYFFSPWRTTRSCKTPICSSKGNHWFCSRMAHRCHSMKRNEACPSLFLIPPTSLQFQ